MKFVFWQNVVSIHQSAFIKALAENNDVTLVAQEEIDAQRTKEKWSVPSMGKAKILVNPDDHIINKLIEGTDVEHVFSGINAYPMVYKAFKRAIKKNLSVAVMMEPYEWAGAKGLLRQWMYRILFWRYGRNIKHLFATGEMGIKCYRKSGFPINRLHQWGYFTEQSNNLSFSEENRIKPNIIFIGKIDERKNILSLAKCAVKLKDKFNHFTIIGTGPLESDLREIISDCSNIEFIGPVFNSEVADYLSQSDLLVLPSLFDGWGAVVNEALSQGVRVLCSDKCGASSILDNDVRGGIFKTFEENDLSEKLEFWISKGILSEEERKIIANWASKHLSGEEAANYFIKKVNNQVTDAPWVTPPQH